MIHKGREIFARVLLLGFLLGLSRGYVAVWEDEDPVPIFRTDTPASALFPGDRETLLRGLRFETREELTAALEDYCS